MIQNEYSVPKRQWSKWSDPARALFNHMYKSMEDQGLLSHPQGPRMNSVHWEVVRFNSSWIAADALMGVDAVAFRK